jgi:fused signal recognition particle receptor
MDILGEGREVGSAAGDGEPRVIVLVGVNGVGKTTTLAKLAARYRAEGKKVLMAAADTFRAAASEQLEVWARRTGAELVRQRAGADPAAVAFDALEAARARSMDVLLVDTAGRLHTKHNLMEELKKIQRVLGKSQPGAPHEVLLVLDATTGQNALSQAREFQEAVAPTGLIVAKLDGTAKAGIILAIRQELGLDVRFVGLGEGMQDLEPFDPGAFVDALLTD